MHCVFRSSDHPWSLHGDTHRQPTDAVAEFKACLGWDCEVPDHPQYLPGLGRHHASLPRVQEDRPRRNHLKLLQVECTFQTV